MWVNLRMFWGGGYLILQMSPGGTEAPCEFDFIDTLHLKGFQLRKPAVG